MVFAAAAGRVPGGAPPPFTSEGYGGATPGDPRFLPVSCDDLSSFDRPRGVVAGGTLASRLPFVGWISMYTDKTTLYPKSRWAAFAVAATIFCLRIIAVQGYFVVAYVVGIYLLNLFIGFLSPQTDPETEGNILPVRESDEYRPFQRRLPEFKFWLQGFRAIALALVCSFVPAFDLPVFWPILVIYFVMLLLITMKQQIKHMIRHKYVPFSWGKQTYGDITRGGKVKHASSSKMNPFGKKCTGSAFPSMQGKPNAFVS